MHIRFDEIDRFTKTYDGIRYLAIIGSHMWYEKIFDRIRYLISEKSGITDIINHNFARIRIDSYKSLPIEKIVTFDNIIILIKSVLNVNKNECFYNIIPGIGPYKDKSNTQYFKMNVFVYYTCYISI